MAVLVVFLLVVSSGLLVIIVELQPREFIILANTPCFSTMKSSSLQLWSVREMSELCLLVWYEAVTNMNPILTYIVLIMKGSSSVPLCKVLKKRLNSDIDGSLLSRSPTVLEVCQDWEFEPLAF